MEEGQVGDLRRSHVAIWHLEIHLIRRGFEDLRSCRLNVVPSGRYTSQGVGALAETDSRRSSGSVPM